MRTRPRTPSRENAAIALVSGREPSYTAAGAERVAAAVALLDRGWGKPTQHVAGDAEAPPVSITFHWADAAPVLPAPEREAIAEADETNDAGGDVLPVASDVARAIACGGMACGQSKGSSVAGR